jgi:hypothetical protein
MVIAKYHLECTFTRTVPALVSLARTTNPPLCLSVRVVLLRVIPFFNRREEVSELQSPGLCTVIVASIYLSV